MILELGDLANSSVASIPLIFRMLISQAIVNKCYCAGFAFCGNAFARRLLFFFVQPKLVGEGLLPPSLFSMAAPLI